MHSVFLSTCLNILQVAAVMSPVLAVVILSSRQHERSAKEHDRQAKERHEAILDTFHQHEEYDKKADAELLAQIRRLTQRGSLKPR